MASRRNDSNPLTGAARSAGRVAGSAARAHGRARRLLVATSWWLGWLGCIALAGVGLLSLAPEASRPLGITDEHLPLAAVGALATASLIGWGCMQQGQARLRRALGRPLALVIFVMVPVAATALGLADERAWVDVTSWPRPDVVLALVRWTNPTLIALSLGAFLSWRTRPRGRLRWGEGAWWTLLVLPYVALLAVVVLHVPAPGGVDEPLAESLATLGRGSLAIQLAIGYVVGDAASG